MKQYNQLTQLVTIGCDGKLSADVTNELYRILIIIDRSKIIYITYNANKENIDDKKLFNFFSN